MFPRQPARSAAIALALVAIAALAAPAHAQVWTETGDAGDIPATAQVTAGNGPLTEIDGNLASPNDADMYCIHVTDVAAFSASLLCVVIQGPNLWLFDASGKGVAMNSFCQASAKGVNGAFLSGPGTYYLAVAYDPLYPYAVANAIWLNGYTPQRAPDGPGAASPVTSWAGPSTPQPLNPYQVKLLGATFCEAATPVANHSWGQVKSIYR